MWCAARQGADGSNDTGNTELASSGCLDAEFVVELPDGSLFNMSDSEGKVVEMPDGTVVEMHNGQVPHSG